jgi:hypothetical protein
MIYRINSPSSCINLQLFVTLIGLEVTGSVMIEYCGVSSGKRANHCHADHSSGSQPLLILRPGVLHCVALLVDADVSEILVTFISRKSRGFIVQL